jgi:hypothetical protein
MHHYIDAPDVIIDSQVFFGLFLLMVLPAIAEDYPHSIRTFSVAKRLAAEVYVYRKVMFYCGLIIGGLGVPHSIFHDLKMNNENPD